MQAERNYHLRCTEKCSNHGFLLEQLKNCCGGKKNLTQKQSRGHAIWKDTRKSALKDVVSWRTKRQRLYKVSTPCLDDHNFKEEELESAAELSTVCSQIVLKCLFLAQIGRPDILWSVNKLARSVTTWTRACDRRLARLISYISSHE